MILAPVKPGFINPSLPKNISTRVKAIKYICQPLSLNQLSNRTLVFRVLILSMNKTIKDVFRENILYLHLPMESKDKIFIKEYAFQNSNNNFFN